METNTMTTNTAACSINWIMYTLVTYLFFGQTERSYAVKCSYGWTGKLCPAQVQEWAFKMHVTPTGSRYTGVKDLYAHHPRCVISKYGGSGVDQNTAVYLLCWRRHVSATVGHLQVTKMYIEENCTECDHSIGAYSKLSMRSRCGLDYTYWAKGTSSK